MMPIKGLIIIVSMCNDIHEMIINVRLTDSTTQSSLNMIFSDYPLECTKEQISSFLWSHSDVL